MVAAPLGEEQDKLPHMRWKMHLEHRGIQRQPLKNYAKKALPVSVSLLQFKSQF